MYTGDRGIFHALIPANPPIHQHNPQTAGPTRKAPPPTHVTLGGRSYDKVVVTAVAALGAIALLSIFGVIAYWCCRQPAQGAYVALRGYTRVS